MSETFVCLDPTFDELQCLVLVFAWYCWCLHGSVCVCVCVVLCCVYVCMYTCICVYVYMYYCVYVHLFMCMYMCVCMCMCVCVYVHSDVCVCIVMYICVLYCICMCVCIVCCVFWWMEIGWVRFPQHIIAPTMCTRLLKKNTKSSFLVLFLLRVMFSRVSMSFFAGVWSGRSALHGCPADFWISLFATSLAVHNLRRECVNAKASKRSGSTQITSFSCVILSLKLVLCCNQRSSLVLWWNSNECKASDWSCVTLISTFSFNIPE